MKGKTKMMIAAIVVIMAGIYYYAAIQYSFIRDMVFHHDLFGDTGSFVPGKKENEQVRDQRK